MVIFREAKPCNGAAVGASRKPQELQETPLRRSYEIF
jgi:hypothetical protein